MIERLDHVQLAMPAGEEDAARAFYGELLGIPEVPKPPRLAARGGCWFERGELKVHLGVENDFRPARKAHPAFRVKDLPALVARLGAADVPVVDDAMEGHHRVYVEDPFGNRLELLEPTEDTVSIPRAIPDIRSDDVEAAASRCSIRAAPESPSWPTWTSLSFVEPRRGSV
jgi:catechol 2,3-dioxygenase-like lactoylglutathione lyase family enzyme